MDFEITIGTKTKMVSISSSGDADPKKLSLVSEGKKSEIEILVHDGERAIASIGNKVYSIIVLKASPSRVIFVANGKVVEALLKQSEISVPGYSTGASVTGEIKSNFPAKIIKINAGIGDSLRKGDTLIVLEAMKMEAQIKVPGDCIIKDIFVKEGEMVERGKTLARVEIR